MEIKKLIIAVFIVFSLSFSYQPSSSFSVKKEYVVYVLDSRYDKTVCDFIKKNETGLFSSLVSLSIKLMLIETSEFTNTS